MSETSGHPHRFRLRAEIDGQAHQFDLPVAGGQIGSASDTEIRVRAHGVSRHHARLVVHEGILIAEDLGSKNGTFVNGHEITRGPLANGDTLRVGPISLRVEHVEAADAELGLALDAQGIPTLIETSAGETRAGDAQAGETSLLSGDHESARGWLELTHDVLCRVTQTPEGDLEAAVARVAQALEAEAVAVVEWVDGRTPAVLAATGSIGDLPQGRALRSAKIDRRDPALRWLEAAGERAMACATIVSRGADPIGVAVWGHVASSARPLIRILARLAHWTRPRDIASLPAGQHAEPDLVFPDGYVRAESSVMRTLYAQMRTLGADVPVLIVGETGVGKELIARTVHASSDRRQGPLITINCAALPAELLEAELFGIGRGVATGVLPRAGTFLEAQGGTLFLDEIGDMALPLQAKLLRALQEKEIHPVGKPAVRVDVRIIAATNTNLSQQMGDGQFRRDLYYRLAGYELAIPALREHAEDVPQLIGHFLRRFAEAAGKSVRGVTVKALQALVAYPWPGNVRELEHEVRRMVDRCPPGQAIDSSMVSDPIIDPPPDLAHLHDDLDLDEPRLDVHLEAVERRLIEHTMGRTRGNQSQAAKRLGISRNGLAKRLKRLGLRPGDPPAGG